MVHLLTSIVTSGADPTRQFILNGDEEDLEFLEDIQDL